MSGISGVYWRPRYNWKLGQMWPAGLEFDVLYAVCVYVLPCQCACVVEKVSDYWPVCGSSLMCQYCPCDSAVVWCQPHYNILLSFPLFIFTPCDPISTSLSCFTSLHQHHCLCNHSQYPSACENILHLASRCKKHAFHLCYLSEMSCLRCLKKGKGRQKAERLSEVRGFMCTAVAERVCS